MNTSAIGMELVFTTRAILDAEGIVSCALRPVCHSPKKPFPPNAAPKSGLRAQVFDLTHLARIVSYRGI